MTHEDQVVLLLDVDGPLGDFHSEAMNVANKMFGLRLALEDFNTWDVTDVLPTQEMKDAMNRAIAEPGFATRILPQPGAREAVDELRSLCEILFVTTPHPKSPTWMRERQEWLQRHFRVEHQDIIHVFKKHHVVGDALVDDRPRTVEKWQARHRHGAGLLWDMAYNRGADGIRRVRAWDEVISLVRDLHQLRSLP